jgi:S-adenosylmethionine:tRNA ribosyltransferase-isomerase
MIVPAPLDLSLAVPNRLSAGAPPEREGRPRDGVRLMIANTASGTVENGVFSRIGEVLRPGDLLVVNTSASVPASVDGIGAGVGRVRLHLSSPIAGDLWTVEPRHPGLVGSDRWEDFPGGEVALPGGAVAVLLAPDARSPRLWITQLGGAGDPVTYMNRHGQPVRYNHNDGAWPLSDYQTVFATEPGSAEMPSGGRPFTHELVTSLVASGVGIAPLVLHCGLASFEAGELPDAERFRVPEPTARLVNDVRSTGGRVVAVGTSTVRALETMSDSWGVVHPGSGVTDLIITPDRGVRSIDGLVTGWHEAGASHLDLVEAVAGSALVAKCYSEAVEMGYLWHEFGDSLVVLGEGRGPR